MGQTCQAGRVDRHGPACPVSGNDEAASDDASEHSNPHSDSEREASASPEEEMPSEEKETPGALEARFAEVRSP